MSTSARLWNHRPQPSEGSTSSYAPVLINRTSLPPPSPEAQNLTYPYPLTLAALLDLGYTGHYQFTHVPAHGVPVHLLIAAATRIVVLGIIVGCSKRWRSRGGWVAGVVGLGVGGAVWEDCKWRLGAKGDGDERQSGYLYMTILICISEYLLFLILLRLSPLLHRSHPLSLRFPSSAHQTAMPFQFDSEDLEYTPRSVRFRRYSSTRNTPGRSRLFSSRRGSGVGVPTVFDNHGLDPGASNSENDEIGYEQEEDDSDMAEEEEEGDDPYFSDSTISESSIIDLPPPLSPNRIIPPSLSIHSGLNIGRTQVSPVLGTVRRSGSARFLGRSWGSIGEALGRGIDGEPGVDREEGYGTFESGSGQGS